MAAQKWHSSGTGKKLEIPRSRPRAWPLPLRPVSVRFSGRWRALKMRRNRAQKGCHPAPSAAGSGCPWRSRPGACKQSKKQHKKRRRNCRKMPPEKGRNGGKSRIKKYAKLRENPSKKRLRKFRKVCTKKDAPWPSPQNPEKWLHGAKNRAQSAEKCAQKRPRRGAGVVVTWWRLWAGACAFLSRSCS